ncbi:hypothetical protein [Streptomyces melanogenes]|uniref:hypothetical protein n=1 Tax=Streptomyces melanogenes TaxID=67326 RepID=UPI001991CF27|nr:hypothetical protein GCM10010278_61800 [Streptomyces melanogenes]
MQVAVAERAARQSLARLVGTPVQVCSAEAVAPSGGEGAAETQAQGGGVGVAGLVEGPQASAARSAGATIVTSEATSGAPLLRPVR